MSKLLRITGAVYDEDGVFGCPSERYDMVMTLVNQRAHSLVAFNWKHERNALVELANKEGITYDVIDGTVPVNVKDMVARYQAGQIKVCSVTHSLRHTASPLHVQACNLVFTNL